MRVLALFAMSASLSSVSAAPTGFPAPEACSYVAAIPGMGLPKGTTYGPLSGPDDYSCGTRYKELPGHTPANNLSFYARGTQSQAKRLRILLNVNNIATAEGARQHLARAAKTLWQSAFKSEMPPAIAAAVSSGVPGRWEHQGYAVELTRSDWPTGRGHEINFVIRDPSYVKGG